MIKAKGMNSFSGTNLHLFNAAKRSYRGRRPFTVMEDHLSSITVKSKARI